MSEFAELKHLAGALPPDALPDYVARLIQALGRKDPEASKNFCTEMRAHAREFAESQEEQIPDLLTLTRATTKGDPYLVLIDDNGKIWYAEVMPFREMADAIQDDNHARLTESETARTDGKWLDEQWSTIGGHVQTRDDALGWAREVLPKPHVCTVCKTNPVTPEDGEDTCKSCLASA